MGKLEADLGTKLDWVAVSHFNTGHPHVMSSSTAGMSWARIWSSMAITSPMAFANGRASW
jgi:hypothetical protein